MMATELVQTFETYPGFGDRTGSIVLEVTAETYFFLMNGGGATKFHIILSNISELGCLHVSQNKL